MLGFSFCDQHCSEFGIMMKSKDRPILPELRRRELEIPSRHGTFDFGNNTYASRIIEIDCFVQKKNIKDFRLHIRDVAKWLSKKGKLMLDDEPEKHYIARIYTAISLEQILTSGIFSLIFECQPFAIRNIVNHTFAITSNNQINIFNYEGTQETGCRVILKNTGTNNIDKLTLFVRKE